MDNVWDIFDCLNWGQGATDNWGWQGPETLPNTLQCPGRPTSESHPAPDVHAAEAETGSRCLLKSLAPWVLAGFLPLAHGHLDPPSQYVLPDKKGGAVLVTPSEQVRGEVDGYSEAGPQEAFYRA